MRRAAGVRPMIPALDAGGIAHAVLLLSAVSAAGIALGSVRVGGVSLGIAGVLFAGLLAGHLGGRADDRILEFVRDLGLVLFVYAIGLQTGPGFLASLRRYGLRLNLLCAGVVGLGLAVTLAARLVGVGAPAAVGLFAGATTNTPSLAAAQQALRDVPGIPEEARTDPGLAYAVAYPGGVLGLILSMVLLRVLLRIDVAREREVYEARHVVERRPLESASLEVANPNLDGLPLERVPAVDEVVVSRLLRDGRVEVPRAETPLRLGDVLLAVGTADALARFRTVVGRLSDVDVRARPSPLTVLRIVVTRPQVLGRTVQDLDVARRYGVRVTRISRAEVEFSPTPQTPLQFGDTVVAIGEEDALRKLAADFGNEVKRLTHPQLIPVFIGIAVGVLVGSIPFHLPGLPAPVRLGLAGGPLLAAIVLARVGHVGSLVWYLPFSANLLLRDLGIVLFLASVGLRSGDRFAVTLLSGDGLLWAACGAAITLVPLLLVGTLARLAGRMNYVTICGLLAGSMTDPPGLAFASASIGSDAPAMAYATVYPLAMILRVVAAQVLVLALT